MNKIILKPLYLIAAISMLSLLSGCTSTSTLVRQHPDFASAKRNVRTIAVLPPDVEFTHVVFTGENARDANEEDIIRKELIMAAKKVIEERGYTVKVELLERLDGSDKPFMFEYEQLKTAYVQVAKDLYKNGAISDEESTKFKVSIGPVANTFSAASGADALILMRYSGFDKSTGQMAKDIFVSALIAALLRSNTAATPAKGAGTVEVVLIDGVSGDILWTNIQGSTTSPYDVMLSATAKLPARIQR